MFGRGHIAEEVGAGCGCDGSSNSRDNVVITWSDVCDQGAEDIEGCFVADALLQVDICLLYTSDAADE